ncbi:MAG: hypothetical protein PHV30_03200 [Candidatus Margulisbacteria bacterium]|nr:hypothetical protein [Candidatus Margulisiibacteriota bacterium]
MLNKVIATDNQINIPTDIIFCLDLESGQLKLPVPEVLAKIYDYKKSSSAEEWPIIVDKLIKIISRMVNSNVDDDVKARALRSIQSCLLNLSDEKYRFIQPRMVRDLELLRSTPQKKWEAFLNQKASDSNVSNKDALDGHPALRIEFHDDLVSLAHINHRCSSLSVDEAIRILSEYISTKNLTQLERNIGRHECKESFWNTFLRQTYSNSNVKYKDILKKQSNLQLEYADGRVTIKYSNYSKTFDVNTAANILAKYAEYMYEADNAQDDAVYSEEFGAGYDYLVNHLRSTDQIKSSELEKWENFLNQVMPVSKKTVSDLVTLTSRANSLVVEINNDVVTIGFNDQACRVDTDEAVEILSEYIGIIDQFGFKDDPLCRGLVMTANMHLFETIKTHLGSTPNITSVESPKWRRFLDQIGPHSKISFRDLLSNINRFRLEADGEWITIGYSTQNCKVSVDKAIRILSEVALVLDRYDRGPSSPCNSNQVSAVFTVLLSNISRYSVIRAADWNNFLMNNQKLKDLIKANELELQFENNQVQIKYKHNDQIYSKSLYFDEAIEVLSSFVSSLKAADLALSSCDEGARLNCLRLKIEAEQEFVDCLKKI